MLLIKSSGFNTLVESNQPETKRVIVTDETTLGLEKSGFNIIQEADKNHFRWDKDAVRIQSQSEDGAYFSFKKSTTGELVIEVCYKFYDWKEQHYVADFNNCYYLGSYTHPWGGPWQGMHHMSGIYGSKAQNYMKNLQNRIFNALRTPFTVTKHLPIVVLRAENISEWPYDKSRTEKCELLFSEEEIICAQAI